MIKQLLLNWGFNTYYQTHLESVAVWCLSQGGDTSLATPYIVVSYIAVSVGLELATLWIRSQVHVYKALKQCMNVFIMNLQCYIYAHTNTLTH